MLTFLFAALALASEPIPKTTGLLVVDARLPAEVFVDGQQIAQTWTAATVSLQLAAGLHKVKVYTNGRPDELDVVVPTNGEVSLLVGRTGMSVDQNTEVSAPVDIDAVDIVVQVRMADSIGARLIIDDARYKVEAGEQLDIAMAAGQHKISIRSEDGTVVWASGMLQVDGPDPVVVQLSEGRLPEVSGRGAFNSRR